MSNVTWFPIDYCNLYLPCKNKDKNNDFFVHTLVSMSIISFEAWKRFGCPTTQEKMDKFRSLHGLRGDCLHITWWNVSGVIKLNECVIPLILQRDDVIIGQPHLVFLSFPCTSWKHVYCSMEFCLSSMLLA